MGKVLIRLLPLHIVLHVLLVVVAVVAELLLLNHDLQYSNMIRLL